MTTDLIAQTSGMSLSIVEGGGRCSVCWRKEREVVYTLVLEYESVYSFDCTYCGAHVSVEESGTATPDGGDYAVGCSESPEFAECGTCGEEYSVWKLKKYRDPDSVSLNVDWGFLPEFSSIHQHHVSYDPSETIPLCASHHAMVHNTDGFRDDLDPYSEVTRVDE